MRCALLGSHPHGLEIACALVESGGHQLIAYTGQPVQAGYVRRWGPSARPVGDMEEVLADPAVEAIIVAGSPANRAVQLRRALQSERHVLCVHPADQSPDIGYEAAMIEGDTKAVLLPLLPEALHPGIARLAELLRDPDGPIGTLHLIEMERGSTGAVLLDARIEGHQPALPGWDVLRHLGGEIAEVSAFAAGEELRAEEPLLLAGRFEQGGLFQASLLPRQEQDYCRLAVAGRRGRAQLFFPLGWHGPAFLRHRDPAGEPCEEAWDAWDPWPVLVAAFEEALRKAADNKQADAATRRPGDGLSVAVPSTEYSVPRTRYPSLPAATEPAPHRYPAAGSFPYPVWQDAIRCLELDDAVRRSLERRRTSTLEYREMTEEVGFKGTMTLVGCGLLWVVLLLLVLSYWLPGLGWVIVPVLLVFLALQLLRWVVPGSPQQDRPGQP